MSDKRLKRVAALVGTTLLTLVTVGALLGSRSAADDLQAKSERALSAAHLDGVRVAFHGREAELSGGTPDDLSKAELIVEGIEGVRWANVVSVAVGPTPAARDTTPTLHLGRTSSGIAISGTVPDPDAAASIKASVAEAFGVAVSGDLVIDASVGSADWINQLPDILDDLVGVKRLTLVIDGQGSLDLGGSIESRAGAENVRSELDVDRPGAVDRRVAWTSSRTGSRSKLPRCSTRQRSTSRPTDLRFPGPTDVGSTRWRPCCGPTPAS